MVFTNTLHNLPIKSAPHAIPFDTLVTGLGGGGGGGGGGSGGAAATEAVVEAKVQSGLSSRAKHGGTVFSAISGSIKDLTTVPGSYNHLGP